MRNNPGTPTYPHAASDDRAREAGKKAFRTMLCAFAVGFTIVAVAAFIATKEVAVLGLVAFIFIGIAAGGWLGQRWLLRSMGDG